MAISEMIPSVTVKSLTSKRSSLLQQILGLGRGLPCSER